MKAGPVTGGQLVTDRPREETLAEYMLRTGKAPPWWASKALVGSGEPAQLSDLAFADLPRDVAGPEMVRPWTTASFGK